MVGGWTGTDNDGTFLWTNTVDMPVAGHTVSVRYVIPTLVKDVRSGHQGAFNRDDGSIVSYTTPASIGSTLFFAGNDGVHGMELWKSDGTEAGTVMVKDILPGSSSSYINYLADVNGTLFFRASDGTNGSELWKSDGTEAGTVMVKDIYPGTGDSNPTYLANIDGTLFFFANGMVPINDQF